ncbi:hypothetical protein [uncultured Cohaesibacter sp.]|uniref:hypothetical protein n=1 Tax=uncultured Cohaesibacter sp. TaxID=1002546 RepID=UPI0029C936FF|nr:hypothetical protein [uncultured Cohaesibacter sp.]
MTFFKTAFASALIAGSTLLGISAASAQELRPNLVLMIQDDDTDTVAENRQRIMSRVRQAVNTSLSAYGYNMYDSGVISQNFITPRNQRLARAALIDVARSITQPPIDAGLLMKVYASAEKNPYSDIYRLNLRVEGDVLNVSSGQVIGGFEATAMEKPVLPVNCDRICILEEVGKHSRVLAEDVSRALDIQIKGYLKSGGVTSRQPQPATIPGAPPATAPMAAAPAPAAPAMPGQCEGFPQSYAMTFIGFELNEQSMIEEFLNSFSCKFQMRNLPSSNSRIGFWYETSANDSVMRRNLRTMLDYMDVNGQINFAGTQIQVTKIPSR